MGKPFTATREDGRSLASIAYEYVVAAIVSGGIRPGSIVMHRELADAMEIEVGPPYYQAMSTANKRLQREHSRSLRSIRGAGYQLIAGTAMVDKAKEVDLRRARSATGRAQDTVNAIDLADVPEMSQKQMVRMVRDGFSFMAMVLEQQAEALAVHEREIEALKHRRLDDKAATAEEIERIRRRLEKLERGES